MWDVGVNVLWDVITGELLDRLEGHTKTVLSLAFSPDGQLLATGSEDETIRLWTVQQQQAQQQQVQQRQSARLLRAARPYEGLNLADVRGLTAAQKATLKLLGAVED